MIACFIIVVVVVVHFVLDYVTLSATFLVDVGFKADKYYWKRWCRCTQPLV